MTLRRSSKKDRTTAAANSGAEATPEDTEPFEDKMKRLTAQLREQQIEARKLDKEIWKNNKSLNVSVVQPKQ